MPDQRLAVISRCLGTLCFSVPAHGAVCLNDAELLSERAFQSRMEHRRKHVNKFIQRVMYVTLGNAPVLMDCLVSEG